MIKRIEFEHTGREYLLESELEPTHRAIRLSLNGNVVKRIPVGECDIDERMLALLREIGAVETASLTRRENFHHAGDEFVIEVWPVGRGFKSSVSLDGKIISGPISWNDVGIFSGAEELIDVMKREIQSGSIGRPIEKDYFH